MALCKTEFQYDVIVEYSDSRNICENFSEWK